MELSASSIKPPSRLGTCQASPIIRAALDQSLVHCLHPPKFTNTHKHSHRYGWPERWTLAGLLICVGRRQNLTGLLFISKIYTLWENYIGCGKVAIFIARHNTSGPREGEGNLGFFLDTNRSIFSLPNLRSVADSIQPCRSMWSPPDIAG